VEPAALSPSMMAYKKYGEFSEETEEESAHRGNIQRKYDIKFKLIGSPPRAFQ